MQTDELSRTQTGALIQRVVDSTAQAVGQGHSVPHPDEETIDSLGAFAALLIAWNKRINLTGASNVGTVISAHFPDALVAATVLPASARVVDVGSGGGLPAIPLAILRPDLRLTLVEPRAKRVAFLRTAIRELGLGNSQVVPGRVEDGHDLGGAFDAALSRATFAPREWLPLGLALVQPGGQVVVFHTQPDDVRDASAEAHLETSFEYLLPDGQPRRLTTFRRST